MRYQFSEDFEYLYIQHEDGSIEGIPVNQLTDEQKKVVYEELYGSRY